MVNKDILATAGGNTVINMWSLKKKKVVKQLIGHSNHIHSLCLLRDDEIIASGSAESNTSIKIWNTRDGSCIRTLKGHEATINYLMPLEGDLMASAS